jgi:hypothetical protein
VIFYEGNGITLHLGNSASFDFLSLPPNTVCVSDPPDDRSTDLKMWKGIREVTDSAHLILNIPYLSDWLHTLREAGFEYKRAVPWPMRETKHGNHAVILCHFGEDPGWTDITGDVDYTPETEFPGERNVHDWRRIIARLTGEVAFDPFPGSGSLLVAAVQNGMRGIGGEISPTFAEMATTRFRAL